MELDTRHQCMIYEGSPSQKLHALAAIIQGKLDEGFRCLYLNSRPMVAGMRSCLAALGIDVVHEIAKTRLVLSSETVTTADGGFECELMLHKLENALDQALTDGYKGLWASGDMTWEFGPKKNFEKLMEYEQGLENLFRKRSELCGICQYHRDTLPHEVTRQGLLTHPALFINETLSWVNPHYLPTALPPNHLAPNPEMDATIAALCQFSNVQNRSGE